MTGGAPLWARMVALADGGHAHAPALRSSAERLRAAMEALDAVGNGTMTGHSLRDILRAQHRARLCWFRATGQQVDMAE